MSQRFLIRTLAVAVSLWLTSPPPVATAARQGAQTLRRGCTRMRLRERDGLPELGEPTAGIPAEIKSTFDGYYSSWSRGRIGEREPAPELPDVQALVEESLPRLALIDAYGQLAYVVVSASRTWLDIVRNETLDYRLGLRNTSRAIETAPPGSMPAQGVPRPPKGPSTPSPPRAAEEAAIPGNGSFGTPPLAGFNVTERVDLLRRLAYHGLVFFSNWTTQGSAESSFEHFLDRILASHISAVMGHAYGSAGGLEGGLASHETTEDSGHFNPAQGLQLVSLLRTFQDQVEGWIEEDSPERPALYLVNCSAVEAGRSSSIRCRVCPPAETSSEAAAAIESLASKLRDPFLSLRFQLQDVLENLGTRYRAWLVQMQERGEGGGDRGPQRDDRVTRRPGPGGAIPGEVGATREPDEGEIPGTDGGTPGEVGATQEPGFGGRPGGRGEGGDDRGPHGGDRVTRGPGPGGAIPGEVGATREPDEGETPGTDGGTPGEVGATREPEIGGRPSLREEVVAIVSGPSEIPYCGSLLVQGSASVGPNLSYTWAITSRQGVSRALTARVRAINDNNSPDLRLRGNLLTVGAVYTVRLTVSTASRGRPHSATHRVGRLPEDVVKPSLVIRHRGLGADNVVLASARLALWADVQFYNSCIEASQVEFEWRAETSDNRTINGALNRGGRNQMFRARRLPVGEPITITVAIPPNGETVHARTTASITVTVQPSALQASVKGGDRVTVGRDAAGMLSLDASGSRDPDDDEGAGLRYSWSCVRNDGASSNCTGLASSQNNSVLEVTPSTLRVGSYTFVVTVRRPEGRGEATARVVVEVVNGDPPQMSLRAPFEGMFQPSRHVVVAANIRNAAQVESVEWLVLKEDESQAVPSTTTFVKKRGTATASFRFRAGALSAGADYTIRATARDGDGNALSMGSTTVTIYEGVTGCRLELGSSEYRVLEILDINVVGCIGAGRLSYKAFAAPSTNPQKRQVLTTVASDRSRLDQVRAVEVEGASTVAVIVKVCDETQSCQVVSQGGLQQIGEATEEDIEAVKNARREAEQRGDFVSALHQNSMLIKYGPRNGTDAEARARHRVYFRDAAADFSNLDVSQWDSVAVELLDSFPVREEDAKVDAVDIIETMLASYLELNPEDFDEDARDSLLKKIGEVLMDLGPDTNDSRVLIHRSRTTMRQITTHVGRGLAEGDSITTTTARNTVHITRVTLQSVRPIQTGSTTLMLPESLEHIGSSMTLTIEEFNDVEDLNSESDRPQNLSGPICSVIFQFPSGRGCVVRYLEDPIEITLPAPMAGRHTCVFFDESEKTWSRKGLETRQAQAGDPVTCETDHLTDFATAEDPNDGGGNNGAGLPVPSDGLTVGAVVGIIVGVLAVCVILFLVAFVFLKVNKNKKVHPDD